MQSKILSAAVAAVSGFSAVGAFGAAGVSHTFSNVNVSTIGTGWNSGGGNLLSAGPAAPTATWVGTRITFNQNNPPLPTQSTFALANAGATGNGLTPAYDFGTTIYYKDSGQTTQITANSGKWFNSTLSTSYPGGNSPLVLSMRNGGTSTNFTDVSVTLFQAATPAATGTLDSSDPTFTRPSSYGGVGNPSPGFSNDRIDVVPFHVPTTGTWLLSLITSSGSAGSIYQGSFDRTAPTANLIRSGSTFYGTGTVPSVGGVVRGNLTGSGYDAATGTIAGIALTAGVQYYFVPSTSSTSSNWQLFSEGPGNGSITVGLVPEPTTLAALAGAGLLALRRRGR